MWNVKQCMNDSFSLTCAMNEAHCYFISLAMWTCNIDIFSNWNRTVIDCLSENQHLLTTSLQIKHFQRLNFSSCQFWMTHCWMWIYIWKTHHFILVLVYTKQTILQLFVTKIIIQLEDSFLPTIIRWFNRIGFNMHRSTFEKY